MFQWAASFAIWWQLFGVDWVGKERARYGFVTGTFCIPLVFFCEVSSCHCWALKLTCWRCRMLFLLDFWTDQFAISNALCKAYLSQQSTACLRRCSFCFCHITRLSWHGVTCWGGMTGRQGGGLGFSSFLPGTDRVTQQDLAAADLMWRPWEGLLRHVETILFQRLPKLSCTKPRSHGQGWMDQTHPWIGNHTRVLQRGQTSSCCFCVPVLKMCWYCAGR